MPKKRGTTKKVKKPTSQKIEEKILHNLVELQKVNTDLSEKFNKLSNQLSDLLSLFEMAARSFASQPSVQSTDKDREFLEKIDKLLEQNKVIAKGLTLMEGKVREKLYGTGTSNPPVYGQPSRSFPPPR